MASIRFARSWGGAIVVALAGLLGVGNAPANDDKASFVASWAAGHINPLPDGTLRFTDQTLREVVRASVGGELVRVRIANTFGTQTLVIGEARIALSAGGSKIVPRSDRVLTFGGKRSVKVYAGSPVLSDPVRLDVKPMAELAISIYLPGSADASTTTLFQGSSFVSSLPGNHAAASDLPSASALVAWPFLSGISVSAAKGSEAIVALADSATLTSEWPRFLAERLQSRHSTDHLGVVSVALAGNRMLH